MPECIGQSLRQLPVVFKSSESLCWSICFQFLHAIPYKTQELQMLKGSRVDCVFLYLSSERLQADTSFFDPTIRENDDVTDKSFFLLILLNGDNQYNRVGSHLNMAF